MPAGRGFGEGQGSAGVRALGHVQHFLARREFFFAVRLVSWVDPAGAISSTLNTATSASESR